MQIRTDDYYPALKTARRVGAIDYHAIQVLRVLWRGYKQGDLTREELDSTLDRLAYSPLPEPTPDELCNDLKSRQDERRAIWQLFEMGQLDDNQATTRLLRTDVAER